MDLLNELYFKEETYEIIGVAYEVHNELGPEFLEAVYQEAFEIELISRKIPYEREKILNIYIKTYSLAKNILQTSIVLIKLSSN